MEKNRKKSGDKGEKIVQAFFNVIGWGDAGTARDVNCSKKTKHARSEAKGGERQTHGIDRNHIYLSPLVRDTADIVVVSVKHINVKYPNSPLTEFKNFMSSLSMDMECFEVSEPCSEQLESLNYRKMKMTGVLIWISSGSEVDAKITDLVDKAKLDPELNFRLIHVLDNNRIGFLTSAIKQIQVAHDSRRLEFYYPSTSMNYASSGKRSGDFLPVDFFTAPIVPLILKGSRNGSTEKDIFVSLTNEKLDSYGLSEVVRSSLDYVNGISCDLEFWVVENDGIDFQEEIKKIRNSSDFKERIGLSEIRVKLIGNDFRDLE